MVPWGRHKFLRASISMCSSSDEYNRRTVIPFTWSMTYSVSTSSSLSTGPGFQPWDVFRVEHRSIRHVFGRQKRSRGAVVPGLFRSEFDVPVGERGSQQWNGLRPPLASWLNLEACGRQLPKVQSHQIPPRYSGA